MKACARGTICVLAGVLLGGMAMGAERDEDGVRRLAGGQQELRYDLESGQFEILSAARRATSGDREEVHAEVLIHDKKGDVIADEAGEGVWLRRGQATVVFQNAAGHEIRVSSPNLTLKRAETTEIDDNLVS